MAAAGPPASMNHNLNGLMNQGQFGAALQHQLQLQQQQLLLSKQPPASKGDAPLHAIQQQQQYGAYDAAIGRQLAPGQYVKYQVRDQGAQGNAGTVQHSAHAADQQKLAQQHPGSVLAGSAVTGALVNTLPAVTGNQQLAQHSAPHPSSAPAPAAAVKQEPGSPAAHSPTSSALPTAPGSPTPELSAPLSAPPPADGSGTAAGGRYKLAPPSPLPPPDASEGPEAAAEYSRYLERWEEGSTMAQRWYRLSQKGVLGDIVEEWEDWQHERLLRGLQAQNKAAARQARKHKRDDVEVDLDAPRQTRTRRVPQALQDYQVEAVTAGTPEPPAIVSGSTPAGPAAAAGVRAMGVPSRAAAQQQTHTAALEDAEVTHTEGAAGSDSMSGAAGTVYMSRAARAAAPVAASKLNRPSAPTAAATGPKAQLVYNKAPAPGPQQQYNGHLYQQQQPQRAVGSNGYVQGAQPQKAQQPQQQARMNGYAADASRAYDSNVMQGSNQAAAAAALGRWPGQAQQQQQQQQSASSVYQQQQASQHQQQMAAAYQQQQNGYHPGSMAPAVSHDMMSQLLHMGGMVTNSAAAAAMPAAAVSMPLPQALAAAAAALPPGIDYNAAFDAFTKVLGRVDPVAFTQHFSAAMQQQRQHH